MATLELNKDAKGVLENGFIRGATFCYTKMQEGSYKYQSKTEKEYSVEVIVDKKTAKEFKKTFPKNGYKEIDTSEFEDKFRIPAPFEGQDEQFIIKMKADCQLGHDAKKSGLKAGDAIPYEWSSRPKVFAPVEGGVDDITMTTLVANGSKGDVSFYIKHNDFGTFPAFTGMLVTDLIEYHKSDGNRSAFGTVVGGLNSDTSQVEQRSSDYEKQEEEENITKNETQEEKGDDEDYDDDIPF